MIFRQLRDAGTGWVEDQAAQMGAALAYYTLFSLMPLLVLVVALLAPTLGTDESKEHILTNIHVVIDDPATLATIRQMLDGISAQDHVGLSVVGVAGLLFGASGMFLSLRSSLLRIWRLPPTADGLVVGFLKTYLVAFLLILLSFAFLIVLVAITFARPFVTEYLQPQFPQSWWTGYATDIGGSTVLLTLLFAFLFRFASDGRVPYRRLWGGSFVSALLFSLGKLALGYYVGFLLASPAYRVVGSVVVFLAWVYYSAQIVFFGAEVIRAGLPRPA